MQTALYQVTDEAITKDKAIEITRTLKQRFNNEIDPYAQVFLFGSTVKNESRPWSDVDVAIVSDRFKGLNNSEDTPLYALLTYQIYSLIEVHTYNPQQWNTGNRFIEEIKETGVEIE